MKQSVSPDDSNYFRVQDRARRRQQLTRRLQRIRRSQAHRDPKRGRGDVLGLAEARTRQTLAGLYRPQNAEKKLEQWWPP